MLYNSIKNNSSTCLLSLFDNFSFELKGFERRRRCSKICFISICLSHSKFIVPNMVKKKLEGRLLKIMVPKVLLSKLDWFLSTIDVLWEKIAGLIEFS